MAPTTVNTQTFLICSSTLVAGSCYTCSESHIIGLCLLLNHCLFQVLVREPLGSMKPRLKDERDEGEEPDRKKVKTEEADTVEGKHESHPQVHKVDMF